MSMTNNYIKVFRVRPIAGGYDAAERAKSEEHFAFFDDTRVNSVMDAVTRAVVSADAFEASGLKHIMCVFADCDGVPPEIQSIGCMSGELTTIPPDAG